MFIYISLERNKTRALACRTPDSSTLLPGSHEGFSRRPFSTQWTQPSVPSQILASPRTAHALAEVNRRVLSKLRYLTVRSAPKLSVRFLEHLGGTTPGKLEEWPRSRASEMINKMHDGCKVPSLTHLTSFQLVETPEYTRYDHPIRNQAMDICFGSDP